MESLDVGPPFRWVGRLLLALILLGLTAFAGGWPGRLQVIAPSTPSLEEYFPLTLIARTEAGGIDRGYTGDVWLWTDGPWIRPFHVRFTPADQGVIRVPVRVELGGFCRIEAYELGGAAQAWSNPLRPIERNAEQPRLLWGAIGAEDEPGLDFRLVVGTPPAETEPDTGGGKPGPALIYAAAASLASGRWLIALNPELPPAKARELAALFTTDSQLKLAAAAAAHAADVVVLRPGENAAAVKAPWLLLVNEEHLPGSVPAEALGAAADEGGLIGVWAAGTDAAAVWRALRRGAAYASWRARPLIELSAQSNGLHGLIAGEGPREVVSISCPGAAGGPSWSTDADRLVLERPGDFTGCALELREPGSPRGSHALVLCRSGMTPAR